MPDKLGTAVVGAAGLGRIHAQAYADDHRCELLYICDRNPDAARELAERHGAVPTTSMSEIVADERVAAVSIAAPGHLHLEPALLLITAGKHVLCDCPLATRLEDARRISMAAEHGSAALAINFRHRFSPACLEAKRRMEKLGRPLHGSITLAQRRDAAARLPDAASLGPQWSLLPHGVDLARWFAGSEPVSVTSMPASGLLASRGIDTFDALHALLDFGGRVVSLEASWTLPEAWPAPAEVAGRFVCEGGAVAFSLGDQGVVACDQSFSLPAVSDEYDVHGLTAGTARLPVRHFINSVLSGGAPVANGRDGLVVTMIVEAILRSAHQKRRVALAELMQPSERELGVIEEEEELLD